MLNHNTLSAALDDWAGTNEDSFLLNALLSAFKKLNDEQILEILGRHGFPVDALNA